MTGSTSGIGLGIARALAAQGVNLVLAGSRERKAGDATDELQKEVASRLEIFALTFASLVQFKDVKMVYCQADLSKVS